jgi:hypothetical protein
LCIGDRFAQVTHVGRRIVCRGQARGHGGDVVSGDPDTYLAIVDFLERLVDLACASSNGRILDPAVVAVAGDEALTEGLGRARLGRCRVSGNG